MPLLPPTPLRRRVLPVQEEEKVAMELQIKLEDERLCDGCPMENTKKRCKAGFVREIGQLVEGQRRRHSGYGIFASWDDDDREECGFIPIRPTACLVAHERAPQAIRTIPSKSDAVTATEVAMRGICRKCHQQHKNYEPCIK